MTSRGRDWPCGTEEAAKELAGWRGRKAASLMWRVAGSQRQPRSCASERAGVRPPRVREGGRGAAAASGAGAEKRPQKGVNGAKRCARHPLRQAGGEAGVEAGGEAGGEAGVEAGVEGGQAGGFTPVTGTVRFERVRDRGCHGRHPRCAPA